MVEETHCPRARRTGLRIWDPLFVYALLSPTFIYWVVGWGYFFDVAEELPYRFSWLYGFTDLKVLGLILYGLACVSICIRRLARSEQSISRFFAGSLILVLAAGDFILLF